MNIKKININQSEQTYGIASDAGYLYAGVATPTTDPGTPDSSVFYIANEHGTYINFNDVTVANGESAILEWNGSWTKKVTGLATFSKVYELNNSINVFGTVNIEIDNINDQKVFDIENLNTNVIFIRIIINGIKTNILTLRLKYNDGSSDSFVTIPSPNITQLYKYTSDKKIKQAILYYPKGYVTQSGSIKYVFFKNTDIDILEMFEKNNNETNEKIEDISIKISDELYNITEKHDIDISSSNQNIFEQSFEPAINNATIKIAINTIETNSGTVTYVLTNQSGLKTYKMIDNKSQILELEFNEPISNIRIYYPSNYVTTRGNAEVTYYRGINKEIINLEKTLSDKIEILENTINDNNSNVKFDISNLKDRIIDEQIKNDFRWKEFDGLYLTMTFDDSNADISDLQDLSEELSVPFCYATIPSKLDNVCNNGEKVRDVLVRAQNNGGEIMSHHSKQLTSSSSIEDYNDVYVKTKKQLVESGFNVYGIITSGGTGYDTQNFNLSTELGRIYYQYGDLTAQNNQDIEQFHNPRTFTDNGLEAVKAYIDKQIISGKCWIRLASHGTNNPNTSTIDIFRQIMQYAQSKNINIVTWKYMYDKFRTSSLQKTIDNILIQV